MRWRMGIVSVAAGAVSLALAPSAMQAASPALPLYDAHEHLVSQDLVRYPRIEHATPAGQAPGGAPPPGGSVSKGRATPTPTAESVLGWWGTAHVEGGAVVQKRGTYGYDNSYILDSAAAHAGQLRPVVVLDATDPATPGKIADWASQRGLAGVRFSGARDADGSFPWISSPVALRSWQAASDAGVAVDLMGVPPGFDPATLGEVMRLSERFPKARIVLDHLGWPPVEGGPGFGFDNPTYRALSTHRNIYYKFTTINLDILLEAKLPADGFLKAAVARLGADHIMWGSDMGNSSGTYAEMVERVLAATATLAPAQRKAVLHDTGKAFFASHPGAGA